MKVIRRIRRRDGIYQRYRMLKHPTKIGTSWKSNKYVHGPRMHPPSRYSEFRLSKTINGKRLVFGRVKGTKNKWEVQSTISKLK
jgi:hypothetical protein